MDDRGYWHDSKEAAEAANERIRAAFGEKTSDIPERPPFTVGIGEMLLIVKANGEQVYGTFDSAEKNKVVLTPKDDGKPRPYLELAEHVQLARATGESVKAMIWDNRNGKIILRTLPV